MPPARSMPGADVRQGRPAVMGAAVLLAAVAVAGLGLPPPALAWNADSEICLQGAPTPAATRAACARALDALQVDAAEAGAAEAGAIERGRLFYRRGLMAIEAEDYAAAVADFDQAIRQDPAAEARILAARAAANRYRQRPEAALADYVRSIALDGEQIDTYRDLAALQASLGRHPDAVASLTRALDHDTENAYVYRDRGRLYLEMGDFQDALADLNRAILIKPDYLGPWRDRAVAFERRGEIRDAVVEYRKILARKPGDRLAVRALARLEVAAPAGSGPEAEPQPAGPALEPRVALVIGNGGYRGRAIAGLPNPPNDATDMAGALRATGFEVTLDLDLDKAALDHAIGAFGRKLQPGTVGLFYYAGHAVQVDGANYLIPIGAEEGFIFDQATRKSDVEARFVNLEKVLGAMAVAKNRLNILILDACRNNPFAASLDDGLAASRYQPPDVYVAYATAPNTVSIDGLGRNSPFTKALLAELRREGAPIEDVFRRVRASVVSETQRLVDARQLETPQIPWSYSSLTKDFFFRPTG